MKKKIICLTALLILTCVMLSSCITSMFGKAGITIPPDTTKRPVETEVTTAPESDEAEKTVYGAKPSYEGIDFAEFIKVDYKGLTVEAEMLPPEITDTLLNGEFNSLIDYYVTSGAMECPSETVKEGVVSEWDYVEISFVGKIDGVAFEGGSSKENDWMIVNDYSSGYIPGFASGIIGANIGETVNVPVTFPEFYDEELAGKDAVFEITVYAKKTYAPTDAIITEFTDGDYKTVEAFMEYYKQYLTDLYRTNLLSDVSDKLEEALRDATTVYSYPNEQFLYYYNSNVSYMTTQAEKLGMSYEDYMAATGENEDALRTKAEESVRDDMMVYYVLEAEGKTYTDDDYNDALDYYVEYNNSLGYNYNRESIESMFEYYYYPGYLRYQLNYERMLQIVFDMTNIVEAK